MIGREQQLRELRDVVALHSYHNGTAGHIHEEPPTLVIVYGCASTGKSMCVAHALKQHAETYAHVDCMAVYSAQELYREMLESMYANYNQSVQGSRVSIDQEEEEDVVTIEGVENGAAHVHDGEDEEAGDTSTEPPQEVAYEGYNSLNFLSFIKAMSVFMERSANASSRHDHRDRHYTQKRVLYLALDHVEKLLERGLSALLTCIFTINDHLGYLNMFSDIQWDVCVILITRAMSLEFEHLVSPFFPTYIPFAPYTPEQVADILVEQLHMQPCANVFRKWLLYLHNLLPIAAQQDWLVYRATVVHLLPDFQSFFSLATEVSLEDEDVAKKHMKKLMRATNDRANTLEQTRRRHLFGYNKLFRNNEASTELISSTDLSRSCLLLVIAGYLASFNPQDMDSNFLSSSGGVRRKKRKRTQAKNESNSSTSTDSSSNKQISQLLIGPRIFKLQRLLAIYLNLRAEASADITDAFASNEAREDIFTHLATLVRMQLFQRTSPPTMLDDMKFRCLADSRFVQHTARYLHFPLETYLNTGT